jgi:hypothetical protein
MRRIVTNQGLALACALGLALGSGACAGDDRPGATDNERDPLASSETSSPSQDRAVGGGTAQQQARVTGCLQRGQIEGTFVLAQARAEGEAGSVGTTGTAATGSQSYSLVNTGDTDLTQYVGSRVAVSGRFQGGTAGSGMGAGTGAGAGTDRSASGTTDPGQTPPTADTAPGARHGADGDAAGGASMDSSADMGSLTANQIVVEEVERVEGECPTS